MFDEATLDKMLGTPSQALIEDMSKIDGDIIILGAGGKIGPSLAVLAKNAVLAAGVNKRVIAVSRFSDPRAVRLLEDNQVEVVSADLQDLKKLYALPDAANVIFMAGRKFGTYGSEWQTWGMNSTLPAFVADKYKHSRIMVFSSGNVYPIVPLYTGGCTEDTAPDPLGEYAMSCLARERAFEYGSNTYGTKIFLYRLCFAVDLRYGVLCDIAERLVAHQPISLEIPVFTYIWQGSANEIAIRALLHCESPAKKMVVTGPEMVSVKYAAERMAKKLGVEPIFSGEQRNDAFFNSSMESCETFGYPRYSAAQLIDWQAEWFLNGGRRLGKPTHFEERGGKY